MLFYISKVLFVYQQVIIVQKYGSKSNLVPRAFCFRGWMVSEKGPGFGWSVLEPDWSMIFNVIIQYMWE